MSTVGAVTTRRIRPTTVTLAVGILVLLQTVVTSIGMTSRVLNADDVWIQLWWGRWRPFDTEIALSPNTWAIHAPISIAAQEIFGRGVGALVVAAVILNVVGLILTLRFIRFLTARLGATEHQQLLVMVMLGTWVVLLSDLFITFGSRVNFRNIEIGLMLFFIQAITEARDGERSTRRFVALAAGIGILCFDDPWFFYVGVMAIVGLIAVRWFLSKASPGELAVLRQLVAGAVGYLVISRLFLLAGVSITDYATPKFADLVDVPERVASSIDLVLALFGADFSGRELRDGETLAHLWRLSTLGLVGVGVWYSRRLIPEPARLAVAGMAAIVVAGVSALVLSDFGQGAFDNVRFARYLAPVAVLIALSAAIPLVLGTNRMRVVLGGAIVVSTCLVGVTMARLFEDRLSDGTDSYLLGEARTIASDLRADGFESGYADFWAGMAMDYWADESIDLSVVGCASGELGINTLSPVDDYAPPIDRTFFVFLTDSLPEGCTLELIDQALGTPTSTRTTTYYTVIVYAPS